MIPRGSTAVMARRTEPPDSLDYFPTPPWATRALFPILRELDPPLEAGLGSCWEPACGEGHMAAVLGELFPAGVLASDVFAYGYGAELDFLGDHAEQPFRPDWIVTNPPFKVGLEFALRALAVAQVGVALFVRTAWLEGETRYNALFRERPPSIVAPFVERCSLVKGCWDPGAGTATSYAWIVWEVNAVHSDVLLRWIPPGRKKALTHPDDVRRFAQPKPVPLLESSGR